MDNVQHIYQTTITQEVIDQVNQACYNNCAYFWDRFPFPDSLPSLVTKYYEPALGKRVLDVGSGTGVLAKWLADQGFEVLCFDPSPEMVRRCHEKGLKTMQCSLQNYQPDGQFAMIFAILSMIHVPKADFLIQIKKLADALPKGGTLFLGMLEGKGEGIFEGSEYPRFFSYYKPEEVTTKVQPHFTQKDYRYFNSGGIGYMLFVLEKI